LLFIIIKLKASTSDYYASKEEKSDTTNDVKEKPAGKKKQGKRKTKSKTSSP